eukprot:14934659-Alexandrium_andersonii.AAC.1
MRITWARGRCTGASALDAGCCLYCEDRWRSGTYFLWALAFRRFWVAACAASASSLELAPGC